MKTKTLAIPNMSRLHEVIMVLVFISLMIEISSSTSELRFVTVVFRHGDRTPTDEGLERYPNDPYLKDGFYPMGPAALTNEGKKREFALGKELRRRYGTFLGEIYVLDDILARSSDFPRTKMSLSLILAALYPPAPMQRWNSELNWQPIPTTYEINDLDVLLMPEKFPRFLKEYERVQSLPEIVLKLEKFRPMMKNLTNFTGKLINGSSDMYYLYHSLMCQFSMGLALPEWTETFFPRGPLYNGALLEYEIRSYNDLLKRLNGGTLLRRITEDMIAKVHNTSRDGAKVPDKMNLFSGHETNVASILQVLGLYEAHVPAYSSAVFVELRRDNDAHYVKVLHYLGIPPTVETLTIPGCKELCPLDDFRRLTKNYIPSNEDLMCHKTVQRSNGSVQLSRFGFYLVLGFFVVINCLV